MNNIPIAEVSRPIPGVNISSLPVAQNVTPVADALENTHHQGIPAVTIGNSKHNRHSSARRTSRRGQEPERRGIFSRSRRVDRDAMRRRMRVRARAERGSRAADARYSALYRQAADHTFSRAGTRRFPRPAPRRAPPTPPPQPRLGCRPDSTNAACVLGGMGAGATIGSVVPVVGTGIGACVGAACGLGAAVKRRFTGTGRRRRKSRKRRGRKHKRKTRKHHKKRRKRKTKHRRKK